MCFSQYVSGKVILDSSKEVKWCIFRKRKKPSFFCYIVILSMTLTLLKRKSKHAVLHQFEFWSAFTQSTCCTDHSGLEVSSFLAGTRCHCPSRPPPPSPPDRFPLLLETQLLNGNGEKCACQQLRARRALHTDHGGTQDLWAASVRQRLMSQTDEAQQGGKGQCWVSSRHQWLYQWLFQSSSSCVSWVG